MSPRSYWLLVICAGRPGNPTGPVARTFPKTLLRSSHCAGVCQRRALAGWRPGVEAVGQETSSLWEWWRCRLSPFVWLFCGNNSEIRFESNVAKFWSTDCEVLVAERKNACSSWWVCWIIPRVLDLVGFIICKWALFGHSANHLHVCKGRRCRQFERTKLSLCHMALECCCAGRTCARIWSSEQAPRMAGCGEWYCRHNARHLEPSIGTWAKCECPLWLEKRSARWSVCAVRWAGNRGEWSGVIFESCLQGCGSALCWKSPQPPLWSGSALLHLRVQIVFRATRQIEIWLPSDRDDNRSLSTDTIRHMRPRANRQPFHERIAYPQPPVASLRGLTPFEKCVTALMANRKQHSNKYETISHELHQDYVCHILEFEDASCCDLMFRSKLPSIVSSPSAYREISSGRICFANFSKRSYSLFWENSGRSGTKWPLVTHLFSTSVWCLTFIPRLRNWFRLVCRQVSSIVVRWIFFAEQMIDKRWWQ